MDNCIFCQIVAGKSPCYKIYDDDLFFGFLDIYPRTKGHTLVVPKKHYKWTYDVPEYDRYWSVVLKLSKALQKVFNTDWITHFTYGAIPHAHIHILPRFSPVITDPKTADLVPERILVSKKEMQEIAKKISKEVATPTKKSTAAVELRLS